jgi:hypothetical protein
VLGLDLSYWPTVSVGDRTVTEGNTIASFRATLDQSEKTARLYWTMGVAGEDLFADFGFDYR